MNELHCVEADMFIGVIVFYLIKLHDYNQLIIGDMKLLFLIINLFQLDLGCK